MEYTKDIILNVNYKKKTSVNILKSWTIMVHKFIKENKLISITLTSLAFLVVIDFALVNSFLEILGKCY